MSAPEITKAQAEEAINALWGEIKNARLIMARNPDDEYIQTSRRERCAMLEASLTLARAGAAVMFPSEEFIDDVARRAAYTGPDAPVSVEVWRGSLYAMVREDRCRSVSQCLTAARAAIAAMKP